MKPPTKAAPTMPETLPDFRKPPVIETVLGVQFDQIPNLTGAHLGLFWGTVVGAWPSVEEAPPLEEVTEHFSEDDLFHALRRRIRFVNAPSPRYLLRNAERTRMLQLQNGRLHLNWLGQGGGNYPRYGQIRQEFDDVYGQFLAFLSAQGFPDPRPNHWEVTYVNHIPRGPLWDSPSDWRRIVSILDMSPRETVDIQFEGLDGEFHYRIPPSRGRLHVKFMRAREAEHTQREVFAIHLTARGPISEGNSETGQMLDSGLNLGRETIVRSFAAITTEEAHKTWERVK